VASLKQKINCRLECDTHKNIRVMGLKTAQKIMINMSNVGLGAQLREDTGLSPAAAVFGAQIVIPNKFLQND
jgi:hypothetical protein